MKLYDDVLAGYVKYNNETWKIMQDNSKLLEGFAKYIIDLASDARFMESSKTIKVTMKIDSEGKLSIVASDIFDSCDTTTSNQ